MGECGREVHRQRRYSRGVIAGCVSRAASRGLDLSDGSLGGSVPVDARGATIGGPRSTASTDQIAFPDPRNNPDRIGAWVVDVTLGRCVAWPHRAEGSKCFDLVCLGGHRTASRVPASAGHTSRGPDADTGICQPTETNPGIADDGMTCRSGTVATARSYAHKRDEKTAVAAVASSRRPLCGTCSTRPRCATDGCSRCFKRMSRVD